MKQLRTGLIVLAFIFAAVIGIAVFTDAAPPGPGFGFAPVTGSAASSVAR